MKHLFPIVLLVLFSCKHKGKQQLFVRNNLHDSIYFVDSVPEKRFAIVICDEHMNRAYRDYDGNWTIEGDVRKVLEQVYREYVRKPYTTAYHCVLGIDTGYSPLKNTRPFKVSISDTIKSYPFKEPQRHHKKVANKIKQDTLVRFNTGSVNLWQLNDDGSIQFPNTPKIIQSKLATLVWKDITDAIDTTKSFLIKDTINKTKQ